MITDKTLSHHKTCVSTDVIYHGYHGNTSYNICYHGNQRLSEASVSNSSFNIFLSRVAMVTRGEYICYYGKLVTRGEYICYHGYQGLSESSLSNSSLSILMSRVTDMTC